MYRLCSDENPGCYQGKNQDVSGCLSQYLVQFSPLQAAQFHVRSLMQIQINEDKGTVRVTFGREDDQYGTNETQEGIRLATEPFSEADDKCLLATLGILMIVAIVVHHEQVVRDQSLCQCKQGELPCPRTGLQIIGKSHGYDAEEEDDQHVTPTHIREVCRVEETEQQAQHTYPYHPPTAPQDEGNADETGQYGHHDDASHHGAWRYPSLGTSPFGPQPVFPVCPFPIVEIIIHQVGIYLHHHGKQQAEDKIKELTGLIGLVGVVPESVSENLAANHIDFEDSVQLAEAVRWGAEAIVTRDKNGFTASPIPVFTPADFVAKYA